MGIIDIHSHILCGVDHGSGSLEETGVMLQKAALAGVDTVIATPHLYTVKTDTDAVKQIFGKVAGVYSDFGAKLRQGFECNYRVLMELEDDIERISEYCIAGTNVLLVEPPARYLPEWWEDRIYDVQRFGMDIVIAHPERCAAFQDDISKVRRMLEIGCELQLSADCLYAGSFSKTKKCALTLLKNGWINYIASDAHCVNDYKVYAKALKQYGGMACGGSFFAELQPGLF